MNRWLEPLLAAAVRAPSGDNTQPWRFTVEGDAIALAVDPGSDPSPMNAGQRMSRIAAGAALENLLRAARALGLVVEFAPDPSPFLARVRFGEGGGDGGPAGPEIERRATNRRPYDSRPLAPEILDRLARQAPPQDGVATHWVVGADRLGPLATTIGRADAVMFGEPAMRNAFLANVRFDRPADEAVEEGLSLGSLELSAPDRVALRIMRRTPAPVLKLMGASAVFAAKARHLIASSSGLLVVSAPDGRPGSDLDVGRSVQGAWLALTAEGLVAQPMMSLPVLENAVESGDGRLRSPRGAARVAGLLAEFRGLVPELGGRRPAWVMRFGYAAPPSGRTGRLPIGRVTSPAPPRPGVMS